MSKVLNLLAFILSYIGVLVLTLMLLSVIPGLVSGSIFVDNVTLLRFLLLYILLFIITTIIAYGYSSILKTDKLIKINYIVIFIWYIFFIIFIYVRRLNYNIPRINLVPFKTIVSSTYDFISLTNHVSVFDYLKIVVFQIIYLTPFFVKLYKKLSNKKFIKFSFVLTISIEVLKYLIYKSFNIDNIILASLGILCTYLCVNIFRDMDIKYRRPCKDET